MEKCFSAEKVFLRRKEYFPPPGSFLLRPFLGRVQWMRRETNRKHKNCKKSRHFARRRSFGDGRELPRESRGAKPPRRLFPVSCARPGRAQLVKKGHGLESLEISVPPGFWGARGGVENGHFCMLFWILPPQDASNAKLHYLPATGGRSLCPTTPVFPALGAFELVPLGGSSPPRPVPGSF